LNEKYYPGFTVSNLTVIDISYDRSNKRSSKYLRCICEYGVEHFYSFRDFGDRIKKGNKCFCSKRKNSRIQNGLKFNKVELVRFHKVENYFTKTEKPRSRTLWDCKCECGVEFVSEAARVIRGSIKSCGCLKIEECKKKLKEINDSVEYSSDEEILLRNKTNSIRNGAILRNLEYRLTEALARELVNNPCFYCGNNEVRDMKCTRKRGYVKTSLSGIDRIDSSLGYIEGNVVPCCKTCNIAKYTQTVDEFKEWVIRVYDHLNLAKHER
jgi:hypothetical protein